MKLVLIVSALLTAAPALISSFAPPISKDILVPRVFAEPKPVRGGGSRPALSEQEIVDRYPSFLEKLDRWPAKDSGNMWLPNKENKEDLYKPPAQGRSGVYIEGNTPIAQFGFDDLEGPARNLRASGYTTWRPVDEEDSDDDSSFRRSSLKTIRESGRSVSSLLGSKSAGKVQAEFKPEKSVPVHPYEVPIAFALERAAQLLAANFNLNSVRFQVSSSTRQKRDNRGGLDSNTPIVTRNVHPHKHPTTHLQKRSSVIDTIGKQEQSASSGTTNATTELESDLQLYIYALNAVQTNITNLLFPFLDTITAATDSDLVYLVLWSVFQDLTGLSNSTGPFSSGWHCLDQLESQYTNHSTSSSNNSSSSTKPSDDEQLEYLALHQILLDIYDYAWTNGSAAVNETGLLNDMASLSGFLLSLNQSTLPPDFLEQSGPVYDFDAFRSRNKGSGGSNGTFFNFTLPGW